jgi:7,8-dihydropterin-6-yl-methyl-4-(beta-D-ribofuranosyl)aminobenzene 5'-phosphate synthase
MKGHWSKFLVIVVTFVMLTGCTPMIPAAPPPTLAPPTPIPPTPTPGPIDLAYAFADRFNARDTEGWASLFVESPFVSVWIEAYNQTGLRDEVAFYSQIEGKLEVSDCRGETDSIVICTVKVRAECIPPHIGALPFEARFLFKDGKIQSITSKEDPDTMRLYRQYDVERWAWQRVNMPEDFAAFETWGSNGLSATEMGQVIHRLCTGYEEYKATLSAAEPTPTTIASADDLKLTILYDNTATEPSLASGWGFAALIEQGGQTLLFDTGESGQFLLDNMEELGVDPRAIEAVVLSHQHDDHTNGLWKLLDGEVHPIVYAPAAFADSFKQRVRDRTELVEVAEPMTVFPGMHLTRPVGSIVEQALVVETPDGSVVITGCAHPGIVEMVRQAQEVVPGRVTLLTGGFHLLETGDNQVESIIAELQQMGVERVMPTHCTGDAAMALFRSEYGAACIEGGVGRTWDSAQE